MIRSLLMAVGALLFTGCVSQEESPPLADPKARATRRARGPVGQVRVGRSRVAPSASPGWDRVERGHFRAGPPLGVNVITPLERLLASPQAPKGKMVRTGGTAQRCGNELLLEEKGRLLAVRPPIPLGAAFGARVEAEGELSTDPAVLKVSQQQCERSTGVRVVLLATSVSMYTAGPR
jgi:hypothetical protein